MNLKKNLNIITEATTVKNKASDYGIKGFKNGLNLKIVKEEYPWILEADIKDAVIGEYQKKLIWYSGTWKNGIFKGFLWRDGIFENGTFENCTWEKGNFLGGTFKNASWNSGTWKGGKWINSKIMISPEKGWKKSEEHP